MIRSRVIWTNHVRKVLRASIRLHTTAAGDSQASSHLPSPLPREHPQNVLNIDPFQIEHDNKVTQSLLRHTNVQTHILVNNFFQSLLMNDYNRSRQVLTRLAERVNVTYYNSSKSNALFSQLNSYYSCLLLLLTTLINNPDVIAVQSVKHLLDEFDALNRRVNSIEIPEELNLVKQEIETKAICCLTFAFSRNLINPMVKTSIASFTKTKMQEYNLKSAQVARGIGILKNKSLMDMFQDICVSARIPFKGTSTPKVHTNWENVVSMEPFKDNHGFISFQNLCLYISLTRYVHDTNDQNLKLYDLYETLNDHDKEEFLRSYHEFNTSKQLNVEHHSLDLIENFDSSYTQNKAKVSRNKKYISINKFKQSNEDIIYPWLTSSIKSLKNTINRLKKAETTENLLEDDKILSQYLVHISMMPKEALVTMMISNTLSATMSSKNGYCRLLDLSQAMSRSFTRLIMKEPAYKSVKEQLLKFFNHNDDGLKLFAVLIKLIISNCKVDISDKDLEGLKLASELLGDKTDPEFLSSGSDGLFHAFNYSLVRLESDTYKVMGAVKLHPFLFQKFKSNDTLAFNKSLYLPMLCPPKPWTSPQRGGFLSDLKPIVSTNDLPTALYYFEKAHGTGQLESLYQGLNNLGKNAWAINSAVLKVMNKVMEYETGFLKLPPRLDSLTADLYEDYHDLKNRRYEYNMIQTLANSYDKNGDIFYLPHNVDFRGRAYPMVSALSHYQEDMVRGIMMFWFLKALGKRGFNWLKYQLVGVYGEDKLTMDQRLDFFEKNKELIIDSAENPLDGQMWWKAGDKPWQTLALCIEINNIFKFAREGGDITKYKTRIPVHQDGSCNGLQHYAALGADKEGGKAVNLTSLENGERGDVYSKVLDVVREKVANDDRNPELAQLASKILSRKLVKQTIMTTVYGVTAYGGSSQISNRLKDLIQDYEVKQKNGEIVDVELIEDLKVKQKKISYYLSTLVLDSISELFSGAKLMQEWLVENCSRVISSFDLDTLQKAMKVEKLDCPNFFSPSMYKPMMWSTLSGFPVVQLYKQTKQHNIPTALQLITINRPQELAPINKRKQLNAIAPNFVHSLDAIHMLMTALAASRQGLAFVSVHDSFWTYPNDVDELSLLLRQEFIRLHSSEIVSHLRDDMVYTTSNSYQLVWVENSKNSLLVNELNEIRKSYPISGNPHKPNTINKVLYHELKLLSDGENKLSILETYNPDLWVRSRNSASYLEPYFTRGSKSKVIKFDMQKYTPVLVPVKILEIPPIGILDINEVLNSKYFFS